MDTQQHTDSMDHQYKIHLVETDDWLQKREMEAKMKREMEGERCIFSDCYAYDKSKETKSGESEPNAAGCQMCVCVSWCGCVCVYVLGQQLWCGAERNNAMSPLSTHYTAHTHTRTASLAAQSHYQH